jgi:hypothetical protein
MHKKKHKVRLDLDIENKTLNCTPHSLVAIKGEGVIWECSTGDAFTIDFGWDTPLPDTCYQAPARQRIEVTIPSGDQEGPYKYIAAVCSAKTGLVYLLDPDLIIRR